MGRARLARPENRVEIVVLGVRVRFCKGLGGIVGMVCGFLWFVLAHGLSVLCRFGMGERSYSVVDSDGIYLKKLASGRRK